MLTWKERKLLIFDRSTFTFIREIDFHSYNGEGWGITFDGDNLIVSDGSPFLTVFQVPSDKDSKLTQVI
jgi:glutamine cyclotransferase